MPVNGEAPIEPLAVRVPEAVRLTGLSRSRVYELMRSGDIEFIKVGGSTLIPYDALRGFIERLRVPGDDRRGHC